MGEPYADLVKALAEAEGRLARMGRVISILMAPPPSTKGMDPKARAQRLHAEWERRRAEVKRLVEAQEPGPAVEAQATALPRFSVSLGHGRWWLDRRCPGRGFAPQVVGPFRTEAEAQKLCDWVNEANQREEAADGG